MKIIPLKLTEEQVEAVEAAFRRDCEMPFSEKVRSLVASGLALFQIEWPQTPQHGGKREGAGRKKSVMQK
jgi:hypothetical protein